MNRIWFVASLLLIEIPLPRSANATTNCNLATPQNVSVPSDHSAVFFWITPHEGDYPQGTDCYDDQKIEITTSITAFNQHYLNNTNQLPWAPITNLEELGPLTQHNYSPTITMTKVVDNIVDRGIIYFNSHGTEGGMNIELHSNETEADAARDAYVAAGTFPASNISAFDHEGVWYVGFTYSGIRDELAPSIDDDAFLFLQVCESILPDGSTAWWDGAHSSAGGAFLGSRLCPDAASSCVLLSEAFRRLACGGPAGEPRRLDLGAAICASEYGTAYELHGNKNWQLIDEAGCDQIAIKFNGTGSWKNSVWSETTLWSSESLDLFGYVGSKSELLEHYDTFGMTGEHVFFYSEENIGQFDRLRFVETDVNGRITGSDFFPPNASSNEELQFAVNLNESLATGSTTTFSPGPVTGEVTRGSDGALHPVGGAWQSATACDPAKVPDVALYSSDPYLLTQEWGGVMGRGWTVRAYLGDGTADDAKVWANLVYTDYLDYLNCCSSEPGCLPPRLPALGVIGDPLFKIQEDPDVYTSLFEMATFPDSYMRCQWSISGESVCPDFGYPANLFGDDLEDLPIYMLPAMSVQEIVNLSDTAARYEAEGGASAGVLVLAGDVADNTPDYPQATESAERFGNIFLANGFPVTELLASSYQSDPVRRTAFDAAINAGVGIVVGAGFTNSHSWPGGFLFDTITPYSWEQHLTRPQSIIVIIPSCSIVAEQLEYEYGRVTQVRRGLFASTGGTTVAFAVGHMTGAWDVQHQLWNEVLALTYGDSEAGTPWPHILFEAKKRALQQYPKLHDYLRSVGALGTMVTKREATVVGIAADQPELEDLAWLSAVRSPASQPQLAFYLPSASTVDLRVYDVEGRLVSTLAEGWTPPGKQIYTWAGRDANGGRLPSGMYFVRLRTPTVVMREKVVLLR